MNFKIYIAKHKEDLNFGSLNYQHSGLAKVWYLIPPDDAKRLEDFLNESFTKERCKFLYRHKDFYISPTLLLKNQIRFKRVIFKIIFFKLNNFSQYINFYLKD